MILQFLGLNNELVVLDIDRQNKKLKIKSSQTNNQLISRPWTDLFDKGKEKEQEEATSKLNSADFIKEISNSMQKAGYYII